MAVDGSHIALPRDEALREYYGATGHELRAVTARASIRYDRENDIIMDAKIEPVTRYSTVVWRAAAIFTASSARGRFFRCARWKGWTA
jgi:hypothetical protein